MASATTGANALAARQKNRRLPAVDVPQVEEVELNRAMEGIKEHLRMYEGDSGAPKERFVTLAELENAGLLTASVKNKFAFVAEVLGAEVSPPAGESTGTTIINNIINNITSGGGSGVDTLEALTDTAVASKTGDDFLQFRSGSWRNFDLYGADIIITGHWTHNDDITMATNVGINWLDASAESIEFLAFTALDEPGLVLTDEAIDIDAPSNVLASEMSYTDIVGYFIDTSVLTNGANYWFWVHAAHGLKAFADLSNSTIMATDSGATVFTGSAATRTQGGAGALNLEYAYQMVHTVDVASNITMQGRSLNGVENKWADFHAMGLNIDSLPPDSFFTSEDISPPSTSVIWQDTAASVTVPAGDYLIALNANFIPLGINDFVTLGFNDGSTNEHVCEDQAFTGSDRMAIGGFWIRESVPENTTFTASHIADGIYGVSHAAITAIRLGGFIESYSEVYLSNIRGPFVTAPGPTPITLNFTALNSGEFMAVGFCRADFTSSGFSGSQQITVDINGGGDVQVARNYQSAQRNNDLFYTKELLPLQTFTVAAGDSVTVKFSILNQPPAASSEEWEGLGVAVFALEAADTVVEKFSAGDPAYPTIIDGLTTEITSAATTIDGTATVVGELLLAEDTSISWLDPTLTPIELLTADLLSSSDQYVDSVQLQCNMDGTDGDTTYTSEDVNLQAGAFIGAAEISIDQSKFGGSSLYCPFSPANGKVTFPQIAPLTLGTGDFTIELWLRFEAVSGNRGIIDFRTLVGTLAPAIWLEPSGTIGFYVTPSFRAQTGVVVADTWYHVAWSRNSAVSRMYLDGTQVGSNYADTNNYVAGAVTVGGLSYTTTLPVGGWIDDVRVTVGAGRYPTDFTVPAAALGGLDELGLIVGDPTRTTQIDGAVTEVTGELAFNSKLNTNVTTVITTSHTAADEHVILVDDDTAAATVTVTLPAVATAKTVYHIKKLGTTASVIVAAAGAETIDGAATAVLTTQYESIMLVSDGTEWHVI